MFNQSERRQNGPTPDPHGKFFRGHTGVPSDNLIGDEVFAGVGQQPYTTARIENDAEGNPIINTSGAGKKQT